MIKKIVFVFVLLCFLCSGCSKKEQSQDVLSNIYKRDKIIVGIRTDAAPFGFKDKRGNIQGFDADLSRLIAKSILGNENKVVFVPVTASNRILKLSSGEVDMLIAAMSVTNQRRQILNFSIPYYTAGQAIMVKSNSDAIGLQDFQNKKLIIVYGSTSERNLRSNVPGIQVLGYRDYDAAYNALKRGVAEGIVADDTMLLGYTIKDKSVKLLPKRYSKEPYAVVFRKEPESARILTQVDYIIGNLQKRGRLNRLLEKWQITD